MTNERRQEIGHRVWQIAYTIEQMNEDALLYGLSPLIKELRELAKELGSPSAPAVSESPRG